MRHARYWFYFIAAVIQLMLAPHLLATTYYVGANGSDSNNGTSTATPWLHAPGMSSCSGSCASHTPVAGDQFIFRGGDTWHYNSGTPAIGGTWSWAWSGNSSNPIYIGVDKTWFSGGSWTRPILNQDNPLSTSQVGSCSFDGANKNSVSISGTYVTFDNFEFTGYCWAGSPSFGAHTLAINSTNDIVSNNYIHGWTHTAGAVDTAYMVYGASGSNFQFVGNVVDGSDTPPNSGFAMYYFCNDIHNNVFRYVSNGAVCLGLTQLHDNLFEHITESFDGKTHGNVAEWNGTAANIHVYNNVVRHIPNLGVTFWIWVSNSSNIYFYNNIMYDIVGAASTNCVMISGQGGSGQNAYLFNNTLNAGCNVRFAVNSGTPCFIGTATFSNNHFIGYGSPGSLANVHSVDSGCSPTINETTGDIYQSTATANAQGYTSGGKCANETTPCAPTSQSNGTVGTGTNETTSCATFGSALCSDTTLGATEVAGNVARYPARQPISRPSGTAWDIGAYQYSATAGSAPQPPTNLAATVN